MKIEVVRSLDGLMAVQEEWEALWLQLQQPNPYQNWAWLRAWVEVSGGERRLSILLLRRDDGELIGIAPLQRVPLIVPWFYVLVSVGQETSISPDFLAKAGYEQEVCRAVQEYASRGWGRAGLVLKLAEPLSVATCMLDSGILNRMGYAAVTPYSERRILSLPESYETFIAGLSTKMRQEMRAAHKKLSTEHMLTFASDAPGGLDDLLALNDKRWGQSGGRKVYEGLYSQLRDTGVLKIFTLHVDGRPAAALSVLLAGKSVYAELAGFDYEVESRHLGKCFYGLIIEWAIRNGYQSLDLSSGNEEYKLRFNPQVHPKYRVEFHGSRFKRWLLALTVRVGRRIRWLREPAIA